MTTAQLFLCDNGACYCADHLGATAKATGRDISGQPIYRLTPSDVRELETHGVAVACERCGATASMIITERLVSLESGF